MKYQRTNSITQVLLMLAMFGTVFGQEDKPNSPQNVDQIAVKLVQRKGEDGRLSNVVSVEIKCFRGDFPLSQIEIKALSLVQRQPFQPGSKSFVGEFSILSLLKESNKQRDSLLVGTPFVFDIDLAEPTWQDGLSAVRNPGTEHHFAALPSGPYSLVVSVSLRDGDKVWSVDSNELKICIEHRSANE